MDFNQQTAKKHHKMLNRVFLALKKGDNVILSPRQYPPDFIRKYKDIIVNMNFDAIKKELQTLKTQQKAKATAARLYAIANMLAARSISAEEWLPDLVKDNGKVKQALQRILQYTKKDRFLTWAAVLYMMEESNLHDEMNLVVKRVFTPIVKRENPEMYEKAVEDAKNFNKELKQHYRKLKMDPPKYKKTPDPIYPLGDKKLGKLARNVAVIVDYALDDTGAAAVMLLEMLKDKAVAKKVNRILAQEFAKFGEGEDE